MSEISSLPRPARAQPSLRAGGRADHHLDLRERAPARRPDPARARARPAPRCQPGHAEPGTGGPRGDRRGRRTPRGRDRRHAVSAAAASSRRSAPTPTGSPRSSTPATPSRRRSPRSRPSRRTDDDLARIDEALDAMEADIEAGGRGVEGDERFHGAVTTAAHSLLLARLMDEIGDLIQGDPDRVALAARPPPVLARRAPRDRRGDPRAAARGSLRGDARARLHGQRRGPAARASSHT